MYLRQLKFTNFKNYKEAELLLSPRINCFIGQNGAGHLLSIFLQKLFQSN
jgi:DNA replication and repair protein RecF